MTLDAVVGERTFAEFYRDQWADAVRLAALLTQRSTAEDFAQDAFTQVFPRYASVDNPEAYLRVAVVNRCRQAHRRRAVELDRLPRLAVAFTAADGEGDLADVVAGLPYRQRAVLVLRYYLDLTESEIAEALGCRPGTVKSTAARALARLNQEIPR